MFTNANYDLLNEFDLITTNRFTPRQSGYYFLYGKVEFGVLPLGTILGIVFNLNGGFIATIFKNRHGVHPECVMTTAVIYLTPNDAVTIAAYQNSGVAQNLAAGVYNTFLCGFRVA